MAAHHWSISNHDVSQVVSPRVSEILVPLVHIILTYSPSTYAGHHMAKYHLEAFTWDGVRCWVPWTDHGHLKRDRMAVKVKVRLKVHMVVKSSWPISSYPRNFISSYPGNKVLPCWKWLEETLSRCCNGGLTAAPPAALPFMASLDSQI